MKVFNILFPFDKEFPQGRGDEHGLQSFYSDDNMRPKQGLRDDHPDKLQENLDNETENAVGNAIKKNNVENINDLALMEKQLSSLQSANEMAMTTIAEKDAKIE